MRGRISFREIAPALVLCALAALLLAGLPWPCPMRLVTGIPCPSCGLTRATRFALRGRFADATAMHPLWLVILPALAGLAIADTWAFVRVRRWGTVIETRAGRRVVLALLAALVVVWIARFFGAFGGPVVA